jgi:hypothetical protein
MFQHLPLPVDGSPLSPSALRQGIAFARDAGNRVTTLRVISEFHAYTCRARMPDCTRALHARDATQPPPY